MDNKNNRVVLKNENQIEVKTSEREMIFYHWLTCVLAFRTWKMLRHEQGKVSVREGESLENVM